jgi:hypothetical protein
VSVGLCVVCCVLCVVCCVLCVVCCVLCVVCCVLFLSSEFMDNSPIKQLLGGRGTGGTFRTGARGCGWVDVLALSDTDGATAAPAGSDDDSRRRHDAVDGITIPGTFADADGRGARSSSPPTSASRLLLYYAAQHQWCRRRV